MGMPTPTPDPASPASIAGAQFRLVRRGFDPAEVSAFLTSVAREMTRLSERERVLDAELRALRSGSSTPVVNEATVARLLGDEAARVLEAARDAAARIRERAEADAAVAVEQAKATGRDMVDEARAYRDRVVADIHQRRDAVRAQLEQALAARTRMLDAFERSREAVAQVLDELSRDAQPVAFDVDATPDPEPVRSTAEAVATRRVVEPVDTGPAAEASSPPAPAPEPEHAASPEPAATPVSNDETMPGPVRDDAPEDDAHVDAHDDAHDAAVIDAATSAATAAPAEPGSGVAPETTLPDTSAAASDAVASAARASVDDLFARLRAARLDTVAERAAVTDPPVTERSVTESSVTESSVAEPVAEPVAAAPVAAEATPPAEPVQVAAPDGATASPADLDAESPFLRRDAAVTPLIVAAARKLKRALADEQNEILARLTGRTAVRQLADALGSLQDADQRYLDAIADELGAAVDAGAASVDGTPGTAARAVAITDAGAQFHDDVVAPLRERLARCVADADGDQAELTSAVRVVYREWKNQRIEERLDDVVHLAYGAGVLAGVTQGTPVRWVIDPRGPSCADAEDNVLGGTVPAGEAFPTGHRCAPAHAGCRCLVQPD